jgi:S-adenosylmethionine hydrolase
MSTSFSVFHITAEHYFLPQRSSTFHGRDVFAPVAAWFSKGIDASKFGYPISDYVTLPVPVPITLYNNIIEGEVIHIDHFGNLMTNIDEQKIVGLRTKNPGKDLKVVIKDTEAPMKNYYSEAGDKKLYSLINSFGYLELFITGGRAADSGASMGEKVRVILA